MVRFIVLVCFTVLIAGCGLLNSFHAEMSDCEQVGVRYAAPDYVTVVEENCSPGSGPGNAGYRATLTIAPDDLAAFQESTGLTEWSTDKTNVQVFADEAVQPGSALVTRFGDGAYLREVLIDTSDNTTYTVYYYHAFVD